MLPEHARRERYAALTETLSKRFQTGILATGNFAGIGIMLPTPYVLIEKDAIENAPIYDPEKRNIVSALALRLLQQVPSYAELSPNNGLHIIIEGRIAKAIFLASPLGQRDKAQDPGRVGRRGHTNYVDRTIDRIIEKRRNPPMRR